MSITTTIIGSFVFRNEGDGCLTSKYNHKDSKQGPFTECCKLTGNLTDHNSSDIRNTPASFVGNYKTTWIEIGNKARNCDLTISPPVNNIYALEWKDKGTIEFEGTAMLFEKLLVGAYWKINC